MKNYSAYPVLFTHHVEMFEYTKQTFDERSFNCLMKFGSMKGWFTPNISRVLWL